MPMAAVTARAAGGIPEPFRTRVGGNGRRRGLRGRQHEFDSGDEAVALARHGLDVTVFGGVVFDGQAQLSDGRVKGTVEGDVDVVRPESFAEFVARDDTIGICEKDLQDSERLADERDADSVAAEFDGIRRHFERPEPVVNRRGEKHLVLSFLPRHCHNRCLSISLPRLICLFVQPLNDSLLSDVRLMGIRLTGGAAAFQAYERHLMQIRSFLKTAFWIAALCGVPGLHASTVQVTLNYLQFPTPNNGPYSLDFTLVGTAGNSVSITNFSGLVSGGTAVSTGNASGAAPNPVLLADGPSAFYNDLFQGITFSTNIGFAITMTNIDSLTPDAFTISLLDSFGQPVPTFDPSGANTLITIDLGTVPQLNSYASDTSQSTNDNRYPVVPAASFASAQVPEPASWMYAVLGFGALLFARKRAMGAALMLATVGSASAQTCALLSQTGGSPITVVAGHESTATALGDFDGDGMPDLAVATTADNTNAVLAVYKGNGSGGFSPYVGSPFALSPTLMNSGDAFSMSAADFNHDGKLDLLLTSTGGSVILIIGLGNGQFNIPTSASIYLDADVGMLKAPLAEVADLNGDGYPDVVISGFSAFVLLNQHGTLVNAQYLSQEHSGVWTGDVNGDGFPDIVTGNGKTYLNDTHGSFTAIAATFTLPAQNANRPTILVGDFSADGLADLLVVSVAPTGKQMQSLLLSGDGAGNFRADAVVVLFPFAASLPFNNVVAGDFNGDGALDFALVQHSGNQTNSFLYVFQNTGHGSFVTASGTPFALGTNGLDGYVSALDINGDGRPDLVVTSNDAQNNAGAYAFVTNALTLTIGVTTSANPAITGHALSISAVLGGAPACAAPTGLVAFYIDNVMFSTGAVVNGKSTVTVPAGLTAGVHNIQAKYVGNNVYQSVTGNYAQLVGGSGCAANWTAQFSVKPGGFVYDRVKRQFVQTVSITNNGPGAVTGPVSLALDGLSSNASLDSPSGYTTCAGPANSPVADMGVCPNTSLAAGGSATVYLRFNDPSMAAIGYTGRVLAGLALR